MDNNKIGVFIAQKRLQKGLTQNELGNRLYVTGKAVSKWERGLSLPDITILEKLAFELDTNIYELLQIKKKDVDIKKLIELERKKMKKMFHKRIFIYCVIVSIILFIISIKILPFGYNIDVVRYEHNTDKIIKLAKPKFSFLLKSNEDSFAYKNIRGKKSLYNDVSMYIKNLEHLSCNNTTYYYDRFSNTTIINYSVKGNIIYNSVLYSIRNGNYCNKVEILEYDKKFGLNKEHVMLNDGSSLFIIFETNGTYNKDKNLYVANLYVGYYDKVGQAPVKLEDSSGTFEVVNDELIYVRTKINYASENIEIPAVSNFIIKNEKLILEDNYLDKYENMVILK
jgi:transcriptional regulator with XRE-family HTH domain